MENCGGGGGVSSASVSSDRQHLPGLCRYNILQYKRELEDVSSGKILPFLCISTIHIVIVPVLVGSGRFRRPRRLLRPLSFAIDSSIVVYQIHHPLYNRFRVN